MLDLSTILNGLSVVYKVGLEIAVALFACTSFLIFTNDSFLVEIGIYEFCSTYSEAIGLVWLLSLFCISLHIFKWLKNEFKKNRQFRVQKSYLKTLSPAEVEVLQNYIINKTKTWDFDLSNGVVGGLVEVKILSRVSSISQLYTFFAFNMNNLIWEHLNKHPELIGLDRSDLE